MLEAKAAERAGASVAEAVGRAFSEAQEPIAVKAPPKAKVKEEPIDAEAVADALDVATATAQPVKPAGLAEVREESESSQEEQPGTRSRSAPPAGPAEPAGLGVEVIRRVRTARRAEDDDQEEAILPPGG